MKKVEKYKENRLVEIAEPFSQLESGPCSFIFALR
jgi:hypothetical protein